MTLTEKNSSIDAWSINEADFPSTGTDIEKLCFLVGYAVLAPSSRNTQPWIWKVDGNSLCLYSHPLSDLPIVDPNGRQMLIGCGAALLHLQVAIRHFGYHANILRFPDSQNPELLACVELDGHYEPTEQDELLFDAIPNRHTNRGVFESRSISPYVLEFLRDDTNRDTVWLKFVEQYADREALVNLIIEGDLEQWHDEEFRVEMAHWIRQNETFEQDGMPADALGFNNIETRLLPTAMRQPLIARLINLDRVQADRDFLLAGGAPVLGVFGTPDHNDSQSDWLAVGETMGRFLLQACAAGLAVSFFNSPAEVSRLWPRIFRILGRKGFIHLIFRLGYPCEASAATPRRPAEQVTFK